jgi:hypothetical protein
MLYATKASLVFASMQSDTSLQGMAGAALFLATKGTEACAFGATLLHDCDLRHE